MGLAGGFLHADDLVVEDEYIEYRWTLVGTNTGPGGTGRRVRIGGFRPGQEIPFTSRGQHLAERAFSVQGEAFVLVGWPADSLAGAGRPVDELRREMNAAGVLHRYHARPGDVDNDLHLVVGHHDGAPAAALARATAAVRDKLAADPADLAIGLSDVTIVAADSHTLAPPLYVGDVPADEAAVLALMP